MTNGSVCGAVLFGFLLVVRVTVTFIVCVGLLCATMYPLSCRPRQAQHTAAMEQAVAAAVATGRAELAKAVSECQAAGEADKAQALAAAKADADAALAAAIAATREAMTAENQAAVAAAHAEGDR